MVFFFAIILLIIIIMVASMYESSSDKNDPQKQGDDDSMYHREEITYHIVDNNVGLPRSANELINQVKIPEPPEPQKKKPKNPRPTLGEKLEFWVDGLGYDTSDQSGIPTNCGPSCSH